MNILAMRESALVLSFVILFLTPDLKVFANSEFVNDSTKVNLLNYQAAQSLEQDAGKSIELALTARALADQLSYQAGSIESLRILGRAYKAQEEYLTSLEHYLQASKALENLKTGATSCWKRKKPLPTSLIGKSFVKSIGSPMVYRADANAICAASASWRNCASKSAMM